VIYIDVIRPIKNCALGVNLILFVTKYSFCFVYSIIGNLMPPLASKSSFHRLLYISLILRPGFVILCYLRPTLSSSIPKSSYHFNCIIDVMLFTYMRISLSLFSLSLGILCISRLTVYTHT